MLLTESQVGRSLKLSGVDIVLLDIRVAVVE